MMKYLKNKLILGVFILLIVSIILSGIYVQVTREFGQLVDNLFGLFHMILAFIIFLLILKEQKKEEKEKNKK